MLRGIKKSKIVCDQMTRSVNTRLRREEQKANKYEHKEKEF